MRTAAVQAEHDWEQQRTGPAVPPDAVDASGHPSVDEWCGALRQEGQEPTLARVVQVTEQFMSQDGGCQCGQAHRDGRQSHLDGDHIVEGATRSTEALRKSHSIELHRDPSLPDVVVRREHRTPLGGGYGFPDAVRQDSQVRVVGPEEVAAAHLTSSFAMMARRISLAPPRMVKPGACTRASRSRRVSRG